MVYGFSKRSETYPTWNELQHAIMRNFGGLDTVQPLQVFDRKIQGVDKHAEVNILVQISFLLHVTYAIFSHFTVTGLDIKILFNNYFFLVAIAA